MAAKPNATVCGIPVKLGGTLTREVPHYGVIQHRAIGKPDARKLLAATHNRTRLPRPGHTVPLCGDLWLTSMSGSLQVEKLGPGEFRGARARRRHVR